MAGGRKHNKKRRKKNWRSVLEGCFNKNPFSTAPSGARESTPTDRENQQGSNNSPRTHPSSSHTEGAQARAEPPQQCDEAPPSIRSEDLPIRGILKKSQTTCSVGSGIYAEAAVDVPDALLHSLRPESEWSQVRPAYLLNNSRHQSDARVASGSNCAFSYQTPPFSSCKSSPDTPFSSQLNKGRPRPNSYHEGDFRCSSNSPAFENPYSTPDVAHKRYSDTPKNHRPFYLSRQTDPACESGRHNQPTYYNIRNKRSTKSAVDEGGLESPVYSRPAYMRYELDQAYAHPLQRAGTPDTKRRRSPQHLRSRLPDESKSIDADPVYVQLEQIQQRKLEKRAQQRQYHISSQQQQDVRVPKGEARSALLYPASSWHGAVIMAANSAPPTRRKLLPMLEYKSPSTAKKINPIENDVHPKALSPKKRPISSMWKKIDSEVEVYNCRSPNSSPDRINSNKITEHIHLSPIERFDRHQDPACSTKSTSDGRVSNYSRYITSALPRSRDPIRKPMGSRHSLSPSNPLARVLPLGVREWSSSNALLVDGRHQDQAQPMHDHQSAIHAAETAAARLLAVEAGSSATLGLDPKAQTVEVSSQIYATVTRSSKCQGRDGASYIYTSCVSWKKEERPTLSRTGIRNIPSTSYTYSYSDDEEDEFYSVNKNQTRGQQRNYTLPSPYSSPPPLPPRRWSVQFVRDDGGHYSGLSARENGGYCQPQGDYYGQQRQYHRQLDSQAGRRQAARPPLPSYEEIIEARIRYGRTRPVSWCGVGSCQVYLYLTE